MVGKSLKKHRLNWLSLVFVSFALLLSSCNYRPRSGASHNDAQTERQQRGKRQDKLRRGQRIEVPLVQEHGVYMINAKVNDVPMKFVFDTGASYISMSLTEVQFLIKQGTIKEEDVLEPIFMTDANGDVTESYVVNLKKLEIGEVVLNNVEASVVPNQSAPLLLGQSALRQFGSFKIDNNRQLLILEND